MMPPTCSKFSSISFSRASSVTLRTRRKHMFAVLKHCLKQAGELYFTTLPCIDIKTLSLYLDSLEPTVDVLEKSEQQEHNGFKTYSIHDVPEATVWHIADIRLQQTIIEILMSQRRGSLRLVFKI